MSDTSIFYKILGSQTENQVSDYRLRGASGYYFMSSEQNILMYFLKNKSAWKGRK
jgi:hypothetical protein